MTAELEVLCRSSGKGTPKYPVASGLLVADYGLEGDGHAGPGLRQVSLLRAEDVDGAKDRFPELAPGAFGENLIVRGLDASALQLGGRIRVGTCLLELTQIGKVCHHDCVIRTRLGDCIMPRLGLFFRVVEGGPVAPGMTVGLVS